MDCFSFVFLCRIDDFLALFVALILHVLRDERIWILESLGCGCWGNGLIVVAFSLFVGGTRKKLVHVASGRFGGFHSAL